MKKLLPLILTASMALQACTQQTKNAEENSGENINATQDKIQQANYKEGTDYLVYERVRILDKVGFTEPQEAYSILLPKGWQTEYDITWNTGADCTGTFREIKATSADKKCSLQMLPDLVFTWSTNQELTQFNQYNSASASFCAYRQPIDAENYLKNVFTQEELGNAEIINTETNALVVNQLQEQNRAGINELKQYGAGEVRFDPSAINASVRWPDGSEGFAVLGANITEIEVPNYYNNTSSKIYTTQITNRTIFKYPKGESEAAKNQFAAIMSSFRTNPAWINAVNTYWTNVRQQKHVAHVGKIKMMDEQTRRIGEQTIKKGQQRLQTMDNQSRSWEQSQNSQDKMHTNFIKTIREVENYQDETGKYEISSGYTNAWSRGDGSSFIMSNNPNFDPSSVFQDQRWKEMKKVE